MESNIFSVLLTRINDRKQHIEQGLATGGAKNFEDYCRLVGEYAALSDTEADIKELEKRYIDL
jgi:tRNA isopentenyl-2-thiomethyl-A-37 hydroxylase MiaE